jgi:predicted amidophosphoribosyltransferase
VELATPIAKRLKLRVRLDLCERSRATEVQSRLDASERKKNLRDVFAVKASVQGMHVALLDDVVTTGATAETLARAFREAGAARISLWSVCRAASTAT